MRWPWKRTSRRLPRPGCGFLSAAEFEALVEGRLEPERRAGFVEHRDSGCGRCALAAADAEVFGGVAEAGVTAWEAKEFEVVRERTLARLFPAPRFRMLSPGRAGLAVAAAAVLIALVVITRTRPPAPSAIRLPWGGEVLVEAMPFSVPPVLRGSDRPDTLWQRAREDYDARRYREAAHHLGVLEKRSPESADASLYLGIADLMAGHTREAGEALSRARVKAEALGLSRAAASWYLALAEIAEGRVVAGRRLLSEAAKEGGPFAERARKALAGTASEDAARPDHP